MFKTDSVFKIGHSHTVCEDFSIHGSFSVHDNEENDTIHYAIVCDGCSTSCTNHGVRKPINTDFGARMLSIFARESLKECLNGVCLISDVKEKIDYVSGWITYKICNLISRMSKEYNVDLSVFDSTLLLSFVSTKHNIGFVIAYGDGCIYVEDDNEIKNIKIEYTTNAPYYISYRTEKYREEAYENEFGSNESFKKVNVLITDKISNETKLYENKVDVYSPEVFVIENTIKIILMSDGVTQFLKNETEVPYTDIVSVLSSNPAGGITFLQRKMNILNKYIKDRELKSFDDFSFAGIFQQIG